MQNAAKRETIRLYFSFNDPYSFMAAGAVRNLAQGYKVEIESVPVSTYDRGRLFSPDICVRDYYRADVKRFAKKAGRELDYLDEYLDATKAMRGFFFAREKMLETKYMNLIFAMRWLNAKDISKTGDILDGLKFLEFDTDSFANALDSDEHNAALEEAVGDAKADRVIGTPFMVFRSERFFGADRLGLLEDLIKSDPSLIIHHDAAYSLIKPGELREAQEKGERIFVLDVRIPKDFAKAHIPGSNCIAFKVVHRSMDRMDRDWRIVVVDDGSVQAGETCFSLATEGFKNVAVLSGGFPGWKGETQSGLDNWQDKLKPR